MKSEKVHTTNYIDTFIQVAEDCPASSGQVPPARGDKKTIATMQFEMLENAPYQFTSDDVLFTVFAQRQELSKIEYEEARKAYFSKGQACLRASPLTKQYGWGVHSNREGKVAIYGCETAQYRDFLKDNCVKVVKAMRR